MPQTANTKEKQASPPQMLTYLHPTPSCGQPRPGLCQPAGYVADSWPGATTGGRWTASRLPGITISPRSGSGAGRRRGSGEEDWGHPWRAGPGRAARGEALTTLPLAVLLPTTPPPPTTGDCVHTRCQGEAALSPGSSLGTHQPSLRPSLQPLAGMWARLRCTWVVLGSPTWRGQVALTKTAEGRGMESLAPG